MQVESSLSSSLLNIGRSSKGYAEIADRVIKEVNDEEQETDDRMLFQESELMEALVEEENLDEEDDFEFTLVRSGQNSAEITADEMFYNGQIRTYPVFGRNILFNDQDTSSTKPELVRSIRLPLGKLMLEDRDPSSSSSSENDELDAIPSGNYCVWTAGQSPSSSTTCKKSKSTGYSRTWRFRDLLHRSHSDRKETLVFLTRVKPTTKTPLKSSTHSPPVTDPNPEKKSSIEATRRSSNEEMASVHEKHYSRNREPRAEDRRQSYLPYRQDLIGFFANINGLSRKASPY